jgi:hypothetical protein
VRFITRAVAQNVLVAQLRAYLFGDVRQLANVLYFKSTATGQFRHFTQQRGPIQFLWRSAAVIQWVKDADRIQSGIRLSRQPLDIVFMVPTMVIAAVGYDEQGPFGVSSGPHLAEAQIYRIEQGSAAFRRCRE